eukprot:TRINITY_DN12631_c1_g2_i15.p3 TRINITY_DN12631_c1_g2~~TRINITY_DN12631_c1_g2_i15.p3  ORF type:complete len:128 (+),score=16.71 TRINITY_DN12631_c1_g2_i15:251-634(+)
MSLQPSRLVMLMLGPIRNPHFEVARLLHPDEIGPLSEFEDGRMLLGIWVEGWEGQNFRHCIVIGAMGNATTWLLNTAKAIKASTNELEWEAVKHATWIPGSERLPCFGDLLVEEIQYQMSEGIHLSA